MSQLLSIVWMLTGYGAKGIRARYTILHRIYRGKDGWTYFKKKEIIGGGIRIK